jgi:methylenetetrahydrofolate dehydrogenase (NADP+)/methenyltetrahydrofolate cyclohydrolase
MAKILYGAPVRDKIKIDLIERIKKLQKKPCLAIAQVGDREDSNVYIRQKQKFGEEIGVEVRLIKPEPASAEALAGEVKRLNEDKNVNGIIVQLPLPDGFETTKIIDLVSAEKDVDGLNTRGYPMCISATARGVMALLDFYEIEIKGKKVAVIGQGILAGKPIANEFEKRGVEVFRCDINTRNIPEIARSCDILILAVGKAGLVTKEFVNDKQVVVDVGINKNMEGKLVGDVNFAEVEPLVSAITPVPGGVGPLTVACLFQNLIDLTE